MGHLHGLDRSWPWIRRQRASHRDTSCNANVCKLPVRYTSANFSVYHSDNDIFIANGLCDSKNHYMFLLTAPRYRELLWPTRRVSGSLTGQVLLSSAEANNTVPLRSLGVPIGNALLIDGLRSEVPKFAPKVSPEAVIRNGALNLQTLTMSPSALRGLREAYSIAISHVNIFLVVVICISVPTASGMEWLNIKKISQQRERERKEKGEQHELREHMHRPSVE